MKTLHIKRTIASLLPATLILAAMITVPASAVSPAKVELGSTSHFAVLAASAITNTGTTTIGGTAGGDVGLYAGTSFGATGVTMTGTTYLSDAAGVAAAAQTDLVTAYDDAAGIALTNTIAADLGGTTLTPGVYNSATNIAITGTLILDAQGDTEAVFIFQSGSTLITASNSEVKLVNGAQGSRVFWQVASSATLGTNSIFVGHILALVSITANTGATVHGQLLARTGAVTLDSNTIINGTYVMVTDYAPLINVTKTSQPLALPSGGGSVRYIYQVTNPGMVALSDVSVIDDKISPVSYVAGDANSDNLLQPGETWIYTAKTTLTATTTNTATASGSANDMTATNTVSATVAVSPPVVPSPVIPSPVVPSPVITTITGGQLPVTATPWYNILLAGIFLAAVGAAGWQMKKRYE